MELKTIINQIAIPVFLAVLAYSSTAYTDSQLAPLIKDIALNKAEIRSSKEHLMRIEKKIDLLIERALK